ncbi:hypothetical protein NLU13_0869 [Sarocladium strictum]|uniref:Uncharacterized protein n=1 Tax=Sarocladium strictum TaxID=5046 RepID=A0AA39LBP2_SARSR|nr:hypothetical protein NLU13_0869 [Sarocladium strictum]
MALWPFRRKSARKRPRSGAALSDAEGPPPRAMTEGVVARAGSLKKQRTEPAKLQRRTRTHSFSPDRQEVLQVDRAARAQHQRGDARDDLQAAWDRTPTLHHGKNGGRDPSRRKSSKRRRRDPNREAEIKAMSNFMPVRPATDSGTAGRPMRKESHRVKSSANHRHWDPHPESEVSLPIPESIHSSMSSDSEFGSFRVSALDALAPRPTLRYAPGTRWPAARASAPIRAASQKKTLAERGPIPEETLRAHKRIDDLADDLDARELRELMERDTRRRQKQRQREQQRMEERLSRRAQKQMAEEAEAKKSGTPPPENLERGVLGRELVGLGIEPASAVVTSSKIRDSHMSESMPDAEPSDDSPRSRPSALDTFHRTDTMPMDEDVSEAVPATEVAIQEPSQQLAPQEGASPNAEHEETVASLPSGSVFAGLLRRNKSRSKSTLGSDHEKTATPPFTKDEDEQARKNSEASTTRPGRFSLSSLLRRGKNRRGSSSHPSFSNTSREEMQAVAYAHAQAQHPGQGQPSQEQLQGQNLSHAQALAQAQALAKLEGKEIPTSLAPSSARYVAKSSAVPKRTRSRFKEDLPEFPISPPASRVQSPEAEPPLPSVTEQTREIATQPMPIPAPRHDTPNSGHRSVEAIRVSPNSPGAHQSMSLASIDSEGSWLSGRVNARRASAMRDSVTHSNRREPLHSSDSPTNSTQEDLAIMEDDYLARLTPSAERNSMAKSLGHMSGDGRPSSDEEDFLDDSDLRWGTVPGSQPHLVDRETMRSRQGMLNAIGADDDEQSSPDSPSSRMGEKADLGRARSVDLASRGHARNFSAGSAKLLDINPRSSVDGKIGPKERRASEPLI